MFSNLKVIFGLTEYYADGSFTSNDSQGAAPDEYELTFLRAAKEA